MEGEAVRMQTLLPVPHHTTPPVGVGVKTRQHPQHDDNTADTTAHPPTPQDLTVYPTQSMEAIREAERTWKTAETRPRQVAREVGAAMIAVVLVMGAVAIRWWNLGEAALSTAEIMAIRDMTTVVGLNPFVTKGFGFPLLLRGWASEFGTSVLAMRALSVVCGALTVAVVYPLARRLAGRRVALLACGLVALSPLHIAYSQLVTRSALLILMSALLALTTTLVVSRPNSWVRWGIWAISALMMMSVAIEGLVLFLAFALICAAKMRYSTRYLIALATAVTLVGSILALAAVFVWHGSLFTLSVGPPTASLNVIFSTLVAFGAGSGSGAIVIGFALLSLVLAAYGAEFLAHSGRETELGITLAWLAGIPLALFLLSVFAPLYTIRLAAIALPPYLILVAAGTMRTGRRLRSQVRRQRWFAALTPRGRGALLSVSGTLPFIVIGGILLVGSGALDITYASANTGGSWSATVHYIESQEQAGDIIAIADSNSTSAQAFTYYLGNGQSSKEIPHVVVTPDYLDAGTTSSGTAQALALLRMNQLMGHHTRVWLVVRADQAASVQQVYYESMPTRYTLESQRTFSGQDMTVVVSLWVDHAK